MVKLTNLEELLQLLPSDADLIAQLHRQLTTPYHTAVEIERNTISYVTAILSLYHIKK